MDCDIHPIQKSLSGYGNSMLYPERQTYGPYPEPQRSDTIYLIKNKLKKVAQLVVFGYISRVNIFECGR